MTNNPLDCRRAGKSGNPSCAHTQTHTDTNTPVLFLNVADISHFQISVAEAIFQPWLHAKEKIISVSSVEELLSSMQ